MIIHCCVELVIRSWGGELGIALHFLLLLGLELGCWCNVHIGYLCDNEFGRDLSRMVAEFSPS